MRTRTVRKSGPKTPEGKARSAQNALKHGLFSRRVLLKDEDPAELEALRIAVFAEEKPIGYLEEMHTDRVVAAVWRMLRAVQVETANMDKIYAEVYATGEGFSQEERHLRALVATFSNRYVQYIREHAAAFDRDLRRAKQDLAYQQLSRQAGGAPVPVGAARIYITTGRPRGRSKGSAKDRRIAFPRNEPLPGIASPTNENDEKSA